MMVTAILTWTAFAAGGIGFWLAGRHRIGWALCAIQSLLYVAYGIVSREWAFIANGVAFGAIFLRNFRRGARAPSRQDHVRLAARSDFRRCDGQPPPPRPAERAVSAASALRR